MILQDRKTRKSGLSSELQAPRHAYMSVLRANSEFETSMIKKLLMIAILLYFLQKYSPTHKTDLIISKTTNHLLLSTVLWSLLCNNKEEKQQICKLIKMYNKKTVLL